MPLVHKEIIRPGIYFHVNRKTGKPEKLPVDANYVRYLHDQGKAMLAAGLSIPVPLEHDPACATMTPAQKAAAQLENNTGWVHDYQMRGDRLFGILDIQKPNVYDDLPRTIKYTSPWLNSFMDGNGKEWKGVISHVALTSRPRITNQEPFPDMQAALSLATDGAMDRLPDTGVFVSRAGLLDQKDGKLAPHYVKAFLAMTDIEKPKPEAKKPPEKPGAKPPEKGAEKPGEKPPEAKGPPGEEKKVEGEEQREVDELGNMVEDELDLSEVLCDIVSALWGVELPEDTTEDNLQQNLLRALMEKLKMDGGVQKPEAPQVPQTPQAPKPQNPILQEHAPMYMSLTADQVKAIADPKERSIAEAFLSLRDQDAAKAKRLEALTKRQLDEAIAVRAGRIERLAKSKLVPQTVLDSLLSQAASAQLSLGDDGVVTDPMESALKMLEQTISNMPDLPTMLLGPPSAFREEPHPADSNGGMSPERQKAVVEQQAKSSGLTAA